MNKKNYTLFIAIAAIGGFLMGLSSFKGTLFYIGLAIALVAMILMLVLYYTKKKTITKNRSVTPFKINCDKNIIEEELKKFLTEKKFVEIDYVNNEKVFQLGSGIWTARKYLTYRFEENVLILESWISMSSGKGIGEEIPLDDKFFAKIPKNQLKKIIDELALRIERINQQ